jgi:3-hydroxyacyl-[acyl-carrier-protein] dehydratase
MPPQLLFDLSGIDLNGCLLDQEGVRNLNPHRGDMEQLNGVIWSNPGEGRILGFKDVRANEFWVPGHIPGRPLLPVVLMVESAAQLASIYIKLYVHWKGFVGFGGIENCKFRQLVEPGVRLHILCQKIWERHHRLCCKSQGVVNGNLVFEAEIVGTVV